MDYLVQDLESEVCSLHEAKQHLECMINRTSLEIVQSRNTQASQIDAQNFPVNALRKTACHVAAEINGVMTVCVDLLELEAKNVEMERLAAYH